MDPKLAYWTAVLINMGFVVGFALRGFILIRRGEVERHRRCMLTAASLVGLFVLSYLFKVIFLGREDLGSWQAWALHSLRIHEVFIALMLLAGSRAGFLAWKFRRVECGVGAEAAGFEENRPSDALRASHRFAGRLAVGAAVSGLIMACVVLAGMYLRG